jgi:hypothetical protein
VAISLCWKDIERGERREERGDDDVDDVKKDTSSRKMKKRYEVEPPCAQ